MMKLVLLLVSSVIKVTKSLTMLVTYVAQKDDELTVVAGEKVTIKKKFCDGWWLVKRGNFVGSVPQVNMKTSGHRQAPARRQSLGRKKRKA